MIFIFRKATLQFVSCLCSNHQMSTQFHFIHFILSISFYPFHFINFIFINFILTISLYQFQFINFNLSISFYQFHFISLKHTPSPHMQTCSPSRNTHGLAINILHNIHLIVEQALVELSPEIPWIHDPTYAY